MFYLIQIIVTIVILAILIAGGVYTYSKFKKGGFKNNSLSLKCFEAIFEMISFLVVACVISVIFVSPLVFSIVEISYETTVGSDVNVFQKIFDYIRATGGILGLGIGVLAGFVVTFVIRNSSHLNRIEEKIMDIQEKLNKE